MQPDTLHIKPLKDTGITHVEVVPVKPGAREARELARLTE